MFKFQVVKGEDMNKKVKFILVVVALVFSFSLVQSPGFFASAQETETLDGALAKAKSAFSSINTYTFMAFLSERHKGCIKEEKVFSTFVENPRKIYFKWQEGGLYTGLQASHVLMRDGAEYFLGKESGVAGIVGAVKFHVKSKVIAKARPHQLPLTSYNIGFLMSHMEEIYNNALSKNKAKVTFDGVKVNPKWNNKMKYFTLELSDNPADGLMYRKAVIGFDEKTSLPLSITLYDFKNRLHARYEIGEFSPNVPVDDSIFDL